MAHRCVVLGLLFAISVTVSAVFMSAPASAHDWCHFRYYRVGSGSTRYMQAWTDSDCDNDRSYPWGADYSVAHAQVLYGGTSTYRINRVALCGPASGTCERTVTLEGSYSTANSFHFLRTLHCSFDNVAGTQHNTNSVGTATLYSNCAPEGLNTHTHNYSP